MFKKRERTIGSARRKRRYDLPLNKGTGTGFLILLIGLMTFLAMMALGASFALSMMQERWSSGLENRVTVEIPAEVNGRLLTSTEVSNASAQLAEMLRSYPSVADVHVLPESEIRDLVRPWLGDGLVLSDMPLPGIISVTLREDAGDNLDILQGKVTALVSQARLDTHQSWLQDVLRFTGALKFAALLLVITIGVTTFTAVAGAVRARMDIYRAEVELLHLMGATDNYIARQFQRYAMLAALQGGVTGATVGAIAMVAIGWTAGRMDINLLPAFSIDAGHIVILALLPLLAAAIAVFTARQTVMRVLITMP
ncbi:MAG: permease [Alphaproteobacteria bacterium]|nr:permease [Alphaproteobacteria bacterium]MBU0860161.1 permease [Alphaproteobacteria bacterium]